MTFVKTLLGAVVLAGGLVSGPALAGTLEATGDFNGDGKVDVASLEARKLDAVLVFDLGGGKFSRTSLLLFDIETVTLTTAARGSEFTAACLRGSGKDCKDTADTRIVLENDGVVVHQAEAASFLYYLKDGNVKSLPLSD